MVMLMATRVASMVVAVTMAVTVFNHFSKRRAWCRDVVTATTTTPGTGRSVDKEQVKHGWALR